MYRQYRSDPLTPREIAARKRSLGLKERHSTQVGPAVTIKPSDDPKFIAPYSIKQISKRRKFSGSRLNDETRRLLEERKAARAAFFASMGRRV